MPYSTTNAPPWIDATLTYTPPTADAPPALNDVNREPRVLPQIRIQGIAGWYDLPDFIDNREGRTYGSGEVAYPGREIGKTLVPECRIESDDRLEFTQIIADLAHGFGDRSGEGVWTITPWAPFADEDTPVIWTFSTLVTGLVFDKAPVLVDNGVTYSWGFVLTLRMSDPRFYVAGTAVYP